MSDVTDKCQHAFVHGQCVKALPDSLLSPQSQLYMHLTNYSVNKHNENFERDETVDKGSKRSISWFTEFLRTNDYDVAKFWGDVSVSGLHVDISCRMCTSTKIRMCGMITKHTTYANNPCIHP